MHLHSFSRQNTQFLHEFSTGGSESERSIVVAIPETAINVPKCHWRKTHGFWYENFCSCVIFKFRNPVSLTVPLGIVLKPWTLSLKKEKTTAKTVSQLKCLEERKLLGFTLEMKDLVLHSLVRTWNFFSVAVLAMNLEWCWGEKDPTNQNLFITLSPYMVYTELIEYKINGHTKASLFSLLFNDQSWRHSNYWTVHELSDLQ